MGSYFCIELWHGIPQQKLFWIAFSSYYIVIIMHAAFMATY